MARRSSAWPRLCLVATLATVFAVLFTVTAYANGGTVRVGNQRAGPYEVTVFTDPTPVRPGVCDVSVAVTRPGTSDLVQNATVAVSASLVGRQGAAVLAPATHEQATNKLFYAAHLQLPSAGVWRVEVTVTGELGAGKVEFDLTAEETGFLDNPAAAGATLALPVAAALVWLSRARRKARR